MTESELLEIFRRALRASLAVPLLAGMASCSSSSTPGSTPDASRAADSGKADSGRKADATHGHDSGKASPPDAGHDSGKTPDTGVDAPRLRDSGVDAGALDSGHDVGAPDTGHDATREDAGHDAEPADARREDAHRADAHHKDAGADARVEDARSDAHDAPPDVFNACTPPTSVDAECPDFFLPPSCFEGGVPAGYPTLGQCSAACGLSGATCEVVDVDGGLIECTPVYPTCGNGRAYANMPRPESRQRSPLGRFFAESAELEAASVDAFRILSGELRAHDAPQELVELTEVAIRDEVRHAKMTRRLARRFGPVAPHRRAQPRPVRPLEAVAEENAVEGCVRETYGALLAHHQAAKASDPEVRATMTRIAVDETRHAVLAWRVAAWMQTRLDADARRRIDARKAEAVRELHEEWTRTMPTALIETSGIPAAPAAKRMLDVLGEGLWDIPRRA